MKSKGSTTHKNPHLLLDSRTIKTTESSEVDDDNKSFGEESKKNSITFDFTHRSSTSGEGVDMKFMEINPLAKRQENSKSPEENLDVSRNMDRFLSRLTPSMREDVESYVAFIVDEKRSVDRRTIRELVEELNNLTVKVEGIHGFNEFVSGSGGDLKDVDVTDGDDDNDDNDDDNNNNVFMKKSNRSEEGRIESLESSSDGSGKGKTSSALWSFMYGAICMLICVYIEHLRSSYIQSRNYK